MKVPLSWLQDYFKERLDHKTLSESLTMAGLEVGNIESIDGDFILDLEITPNRSDCLSILGVAREVSALLRIKLKEPEFKITRELRDDKFKISIIDTELCYRYAGRIIRGLKVGNSPKWLRDRLERSGIRSINNVVDVTNYVLLEYGHPLHAFDLDLLEDYCIRVGTPKSLSGNDYEEIETLDGVKRKVYNDDLLIWDGKKPIAVAGVMGGANTEVTEKTSNILLESAYFKPESIRKTAKRLGLSTEASYRFERGTDIEKLKVALDRAAYLIQEIAGGEIYKAIDVYPIKICQKNIKFTPKRICKFLGLELSEDQIAEILTLLDIEVTKDKDFYIAKIPTHRNDISIEEDLAEEVARIYGYEKVPAEIPQSLKPVKENYELKEKRNFFNKIRDYMIAIGFSEAINMSFMSTEDLDIFEIPLEDQRRKTVSLLNPLRQEESLMRTTLVPSLIKNIEKNTSKGIECLKIFEIARVFIRNNTSALPFEPFYFALASKREELKTPFNEDPYDFYALKGVIEGLSRHLKLGDLAFKRSSEVFLHVGQSADIYLGQEKIGFIGVLSPKIVSKFDFKSKPYIVISELNLDILFKAYKSTPLISYKPLSNYPPIKRDTAILVSSDFEVQRILNIIKNFGSQLIEDVYIFDVYKGKGIPEDRKSIAFRVTYRAFDRTLTSEEVDNIHRRLIEKISIETGATLRI